MSRFARSLKGRITIIVAIAVFVTGTVVLLYGYFLSRSIFTDQVLRSMESVVSRTSREVLATEQNMSSLAEIVAGNDAMRSAMTAYTDGTGDRAALSARMTAILAAGLKAVPTFTGMSLVAADGSVISSIDETGRSPFLPPTATSFQSILLTLQAGRSWADFSYRDREMSVSLATGIDRTGTRDVIGMVVTTGRSTEMERVLGDTSGLGDTGKILLSEQQAGKVKVLDLPNRFATTTEANKNAFKMYSTQSDLPPVKAALGQKGEGEAVINGSKVIASYDNITVLSWGVTATTDSSEAFAPIVRFRNVIMIVILALLFGGTALAFLIARSLSRPIIELQEGVKALSGSSLGTRVDIHDGVEVTELAREFNKMAERLKESYDSLEQKVEDRTSELIDANERLRDANERLKELDSLKSDFVSVASHELRSPLASMKMGVSNVSNEIVGPLNEDQKLMLQIVERNTDRLIKLTTDLLDLTKIEAGQLDLQVGKCDMVELANEVALSLEAQAEHQGIYVKVEPGDAPAFAKCDRDRIYQVIQNLVSNAMRFTEEGGVSIIVGYRGPLIEICVEDTGIGIPAEALGSVFDKFSQAHSDTRSEKRGTGLGLAITKGIVEAHGGTVTAHSEEGKGSRFCFTLPATDDGD